MAACSGEHSNAPILYVLSAHSNLNDHSGLVDGLALTELLKDKNIVLANTYEYRQPSSKQRAEAAVKAGDEAVTLDMTSRFLGLVVVPGHHIVKMEVEQFASQMRNQNFI
ncbi:LSM domain-containing protein 1 [Ilyonectria robusta]